MYENDTLDSWEYIASMLGERNVRRAGAGVIQAGKTEVFG